MLTPAHLRAALAAAALTAAPAAAQDLGMKAGAPERVAIVGATVHPVSGPPIENGLVQFKDGVITSVGPLGGKDPAVFERDGWTLIDAAGKHVYPGLIAPYTQLGLTEISAVRATIDYAERGDATPEVRAAVAVNPDSTLLPVARAGGVLLAGVFPLTTASGLINYFEGPGGVVPGRAGAVRLDGWTWEDMAIDDSAGLVVNWPPMRPIAAWWMDKPEEEQIRARDAHLAVIRDLIRGAKAYRAARADGAQNPVDIRYEAVLSVLPPKGAAPDGPAAQDPVLVLAHDYDQIQAAVQFCASEGLRCVIVGGQDAPMCADLLKRHGVPVIVQGTIRFPKRADGGFDEAYTLPARLEEAGVAWCLASGEEAAHERNLPYAAALAVAHGLPHDAGVRSITLSAAEALGIADRYGSLEPGKSATLILADGDILEVTTTVSHAWIDGRAADLRTKQTALEAKYREKYRRSGDLTAPAPAAPPGAPRR